MSRLFRKKDDLPKRSLWQRVKDVVRTDFGVLLRGGVDQGSLEALETLLIESDFGVPTSLALVAEVERLAKRGDVKTDDGVSRCAGQRRRGGAACGQLRSGAASRGVRADGAARHRRERRRQDDVHRQALGATSAAEGRKVLVGAADTFRAGAIDQLRVWAQRAGADFVGGAPGSDPASVAFDAVDAGVTRGCDIVIVDTAGRLHTSDDLMTELRKIHRVIAKRLPGAPHEVLLVLDGTIGQNALAQAQHVLGRRAGHRPRRHEARWHRQGRHRRRGA